jgi:hypothetical protein
MNPMRCIEYFAYTRFPSRTTLILPPVESRSAVRASAAVFFDCYLLDRR